MLFLFQPSKQDVSRFLDRAARLEFSYSELGSTNSTLMPPLFTIDHNRIRVGTGSSAWNKAVDAVRRWEMFNLGWVRLYESHTPILPDSNVAVLARWGCFWLNACRVVYVIDEDGPSKRFGFAYGTLSDHAESGEERFLVEWNGETDEVEYDLLAFSRPNQLLAQVGRPFARRLQKRFARDSMTAMMRAVGS